MPKTVRSLDQIKTDLADDVKGINQYVATTAGPIKSVYIDPIAPHIQSAEQDRFRISQIFNLGVLQIAEDELTSDQIADIESLGNSRGVPRFSGRRATCRGVFYRSSAPPRGQTISISNGDLVGTSDSSYRFRVINGPYEMDGNLSAMYYKSANKRYEIEVELESIGYGEDHNVAKGLINRKLSRLSDWDGFENTTEAIRGLGKESLTSYIGRLSEAMTYNRAGSKRDSIGDIGVSLRSEFSAVTSVTVLTSADPTSFQRRKNTGPAIDIYVNGSETESWSDKVTTVANDEKVWVMERQPVSSIDRVSINGSVVDPDDWTFFEDTSRETGSSARASGYVQLRTTVDSTESSITVTAGDVVLIEYSYDATVREAQIWADSSYNDLFSTDMLVRLPSPVPLVIKISGGTLGSYSTASVRDSVYSAILSALHRPEEFLSTMTPSYFGDLLIENSVGLISSLYSDTTGGLKVEEFRRKDKGTFEVEVLNFEAWEQPTVAIADIDLSDLT